MLGLSEDEDLIEFEEHAAIPEELRQRSRIYRLFRERNRFITDPRTFDKYVVNRGEPVEAVFPAGDARDFVSRGNICPRNDESLAMNEVVLDRLPGDTVEYLSIDEISTEDELTHVVSVEFLHSIPPHRLRLRRGEVVMLPRNMGVDRGLGNGTRLWSGGWESPLPTQRW